MSYYLENNEAIQLANSLAEYLKNKEFEKHPHIGLLGPRIRRTEVNAETKLLQYSPEEESDLILSETVEERSSERIIPYITGFRCRLQKLIADAMIKFSYSFWIRIAPPDFPNKDDEFRKIELISETEDGSSFKVTLTVMNKKESILFSSTQIFTNQESKVSIPDKAFRASRDLLSTPSGSFRLMRRFEPFASQKNKKQEVWYTASDFAYVYGLSLTQSLVQKDETGEWELRVRLVNEGGWLAKRPDTSTPVSIEIEKDFRKQVYDENDETWSVGYFYDVLGQLDLPGFRRSWKPTGRGIRGMYTINSVYQELSGSVILRDFAVDSESVPLMQSSAMNVKSFVSSSLQEYSESNSIPVHSIQPVSAALSQALADMGIKNLYVFQEESTRKILSSIGTNKAVAIAARTAAGKTLAFLLPISAFCYTESIQGAKPGVKSVLFYPTKALCHDQADTILELLWHSNIYFRKLGLDAIVSVGILHGNTYSDYEILEAMKQGEGEEIEKELRYKCPICSSRLIISFAKTEISMPEETEDVTYPETGTRLAWEVSCSGRESDSCPLRRTSSDPSSPELIAFLNKMLRPTRTSVYSNPPDILIATPDMLSYRLFRSPHQHSIFGRSLHVCSSCNRTSAQLSKKTCEYCGTKLAAAKDFSYPKIIVFDEAHQLRGSFGTQVSYVVSRFQQALKEINRLEAYHPLFIFSSATFNNPERFVSRFLDEKRIIVERINAQYSMSRGNEPDTENLQYVRSHLFIMPKGYTPNATLTKLVQQCFSYFVRNKNRYPNILIFSNQLSITSELINEMNNALVGYLDKEKLMLSKRPTIDGHSTDWDTERADVEDRFSKGEIDVLVATRGLEVGVDFDRIDVLIMYGSPFYVSDYLQRIGRAARNHSALAISVHLDKPIDFFFLRNFRLISNAAIRDEALMSEGTTITRDNPVIYRRTLARAVLDYLCTRLDSFRFYSQKIKGRAANSRTNLSILFKYLFDDSTSAKYIKAYIEGSDAPPPESEVSPNPVLFEYVKRSVGERVDTSDVLREIVTSIAEHLENIDEGTLSELIRSRSFERKFFLTQLRNADYNVNVKYEDLLQFRKAITKGQSSESFTRPRALGVAVGHYSEHQMTAYRKRVFIVSRVDPNQEESENIRRLMLPEDQ